MGKPTKYQKRPQRFRVEVIAGSTLKAAAALYDLLAQRGPNTPVSVRRLIFDHEKLSPADLVSAAEGRHLAPGDTHVAADKPQGRVSVQQAIEAGWMPSTDDVSRQAQAPDNDGAGGIPREGYERALLNAEHSRKAICQYLQQAIEYEIRWLSAANGDGISQQNFRVPVHIIVTTVGGMGNGSLVWFVTEGIVSCAEASRVEAKIVPELLSIGNLSIQDDDQARLNEFLCFMFIQALATGTYLNAVTQRIVPVPFDHVRVFSNRNRGGRIGSLKALVHHQAQFQRFYWDTPAGADMQEREPDIGHWGYGQFEEPRCVYTGSTGSIHWNKGRLLDSLAYQAAELLAREFLTDADPEQAIRDAAALAAASHLIESDDENQVTTTISHPDMLGGQSVYAAAEQSLIEPLAGLRGIERGSQLAERTPLVRDEVRSVHHPQMRDEAREVVEEVVDTLSRRLDQILRQPHGLARAITFLQAVESTLDRSGHAIAAKIGEIQEFLASHERAFAEAEEQFQEIAEQGRIRRSLSFQAGRALSAVLEDSGRAVVNYELQIAACTVAMEDVIAPLRDFLEGRLAELLSARHNLSEFIPHCGNMARHKANERTVEDPAVGLELVTEEYVEAYFTEYLARNGGAESAVDQWRSAFLQTHGSLSIFVGAPAAQMEAFLLDVCRAVFEPALDNTNVLVEFQRVYPDEATQRDILAELISQSEGRLVVDGEVNKSIAWIKTANVPTEPQADWMRRLLESTDRKGGKWQVAVNPADPETFSIGQLRGEISLRHFIDALGIEDNYETWRRLVERAADPVSAIGVGPNPTPRQFRRALAKAIAPGLLSVNADGSFVFRDLTGEELILGTDAEAVFQELQPRFRRLVFIESYFASELVDSEAAIVSRLEEMKTHLQDASDDKLLGLITAAAVLECLQQADLLRPWARRIQKRRKTTKHEA